MKPTPDDPRLSAWLLGELTADEAAEVERAVARDPALQAAVADLRAVTSLLSSTLAAPGLRPHQREAVLQAGRTAVPFPAERRRRSHHWQALLATAAVVMAGAFLALKIRPGGPAVAERSAREIEGGYPGPRVSPAERSPADARAAREHQAHRLESGPELAGNELVAELPATMPPPPPLAAAEIELPLLVGNASYGRVRDWIRGKNQLPPKEDVRLEELANAFPMPPETESESVAGLRVACVSMLSPWSGTRRLVGVQIANESGRAREVAWSFRPAPGSRAAGVRVLATTGGGGAAADLLPPGRRTLVLIELPSAAGHAGDLVISSGGRTRRIPAVEKADAGMEPAALVAAFGLWLRGEGIDDSALREILASASTQDQRAGEVRQLVGRALEIAAGR